MSLERLGQKAQDAITGLLLLFAAFPVILLLGGWTGSVIGFVMMSWGLMLASKLLSPLLINLPYVGALIQKGRLRFALVAALAVTLVFLIVEWLWYYILGLCLVALLVALALWLLRNKIPWNIVRKQPTATSEENSSCSQAPLGNAEHRSSASASDEQTPPNPHPREAELR